MILNKKINLASKLVGMILATGASSLVFAEENDPLEEKPKWYEVEIVIFKSTSMKGLSKESWQVDTPIEAPKDLIDFLQTYRLVAGAPQLEEEEESNETDSSVNQASESSTAESSETRVETIETASENSNENALAGNASQTQTEGLTEDHANLAIDEVEEEKPFQILENNLLQLNNEVTSLQRHPEYKVLSHFAWRQPVLGASEARHIRIAAGADFSLEYNYLGEKRLSHFEQAETTDAKEGVESKIDSTESSIEEAQNSSTDNYFEIETNQESHSSLEQNAETDEEPIELPLSDLLVPELWVPEIDGDIKVYVGRYLHVKTNLFLRRPDREEVEAIDLDVFSNEQLSSLTSIEGQNTQQNSIFDNNPLNILDQTSNSIESDAAATDSLIDLTSDASNESTDLDLIDSQQFSWEIDDDFLTKESEKMYVEKLFNYPLRQSRRMRSKELHYFDHPLFGMLIMITPYEKDSLDDLALEDAE